MAIASWSMRAAGKRAVLKLLFSLAGKLTLRIESKAQLVRTRTQPRIAHRFRKREQNTAAGKQCLILVGCAMRRDDVIAKLKEAEPALRARGIRRAAVFGSIARGDDG